MMKNKMFLGMQFDEVLKQLQAMGIEPDECDYPSEEETGSIIVGDVYGAHYSIEFDTENICDFCGW